MKIIQGNIFDLSLEPDAICFTTSHSIEGNEVVMHSPSAQMVHKNMPNVARKLADALLPDIWVQCIPVDEIKGIQLVSFQTKPVKLAFLDEESAKFLHGTKPQLGDFYPGYRGVSYSYVCSLAAKKLAKLATEKGWKRVVLPVPDDCDLEKVLPFIKEHLDDRFIMIED